MSFVHVETADAVVAELAQHAHAADAEDHLLAEPDASSPPYRQSVSLRSPSSFSGRSASRSRSDAVAAADPVTR